MLSFSNSSNVVSSKARKRKQTFVSRVLTSICFTLPFEPCRFPTAAKEKKKKSSRRGLQRDVACQNLRLVQGTNHKTLFWIITTSSLMFKRSSSFFLSLQLVKSLFPQLEDTLIGSNPRLCFRRFPQSRSISNTDINGINSIASLNSSLVISYLILSSERFFNPSLPSLPLRPLVSSPFSSFQLLQVRNLSHLKDPIPISPFHLNHAHSLSSVLFSVKKKKKNCSPHLYSLASLFRLFRLVGSIRISLNL